MAKVKNKRNAGAADRADQKRKAEANKKKLNPFEVHINREKHKILGKKSKHDRGLPGVSRAKAIQKRKETLGTEMKLMHKTNTFIDKRIGEKNNELSAEDKMVARFAAERVKQHSRKNIYNLADDEVLTHRGQTLEQIEKFDDPRSDEEDEAGFKGLDDDFVADGHFGGGVLSRSDRDGAKSHKDLIEQLIAESKKRKAEKQKEKEQTLDLTEKLDSEWKDLQPVVFKRARVEEESVIDKLLGKAEQNSQDYDRMMRELRFEKRGTPSNAIKSDEKLEKEEQLRIAQLEKERDLRMLGDIGEATSQPARKHRSADDLEDNFFLEDEKEFMLAYDNEGKPLVPDHVLKSYSVPNAKQNYDGGLTESSNDEEDGDENSDDDEESGDESEEEETKSDNVKDENKDKPTGTEKSILFRDSGDSEDGNDEEDEDDDSGDDIKEKPRKVTEENSNAIESNEDLKLNKKTTKNNSSKVKVSENVESDDSDENESEKSNENNEGRKLSKKTTKDNSTKVKPTENVESDDSDKDANESNSIIDSKFNVTGKGDFDDVEDENSENDDEDSSDQEEPEKKKSQSNIQKEVKQKRRKLIGDSDSDEKQSNDEEDKDDELLKSFLGKTTEYENLKKLLSGKNPSQQSTALQKLIKSYDPSLGENNKELLSRLFANMLQYVNDLFANLKEEGEMLKSYLIMNKISPYFYDIAHINKVSSKKFFAELLKEKHDDYLKKPKRIPDFDTLIFFKLISLLYPTSDFRHPLTTPSLRFMSEILTTCKFRDAFSISRGLFVTTLILEYTALSRRYVPAAVNFLRGILYMCAKTTILNPIQVVPPFRLHKDAKILNLEDDCSKLDAGWKMTRKDLFSDSIDNEFKIRTVLNATVMLKEFFDNCNEMEAQECIFEPHIQLLSRLELELYPKKVAKTIEGIIKYMKGSLEVKTFSPLTIEKPKPKTLRLYEPEIQEVFTGSKSSKLSRDMAERQRLQHKYKREMKGALREIRRDKAYIASVKIRDKIKSDNVRKEKVKQIYKDASIQQGELNKLKRGK